MQAHTIWTLIFLMSSRTWSQFSGWLRESFLQLRRNTHDCQPMVASPEIFPGNNEAYKRLSGHEMRSLFN